MVEAVNVAPLRAVADDAPGNREAGRSQTIPRTAVALRVSGPWWNSFLAVASRPHLSHVSACQRRSRPQTFALVFSAVAVDSFIVLCHIFSGIGLPRLCGTPCRWIVVSWVEPHRSIHIRHAAIVLANIVSTDIGVHLHTLLGDNITSPATPMFFGSSGSWS